MIPVLIFSLPLHEYSSAVNFSRKHQIILNIHYLTKVLFTISLCFERVFYAYQGCIYLIKNIVKTIILLQVKPVQLYAF